MMSENETNNQDFDTTIIKEKGKVVSFFIVWSQQKLLDMFKPFSLLLNQHQKLEILSYPFFILLWTVFILGLILGRILQ